MQPYTNMRTSLFFSIFVALTSLYQVCQAQATFRYGAELGFALSQIPIRHTYTIPYRNDEVTETYRPLVSPLVGLTTDLTIIKHLYFSLGLQYQMTGQRYHYHRDGNDMLLGNTYRSDNWENQTFHKLCLPIAAGFTSKIWGIRPAFFIGYRYNYFIGGKHYSKVLFDHDDPSKNYGHERAFSPFDPKRTGWTIDRFLPQLFCGFSASVKDNFKISATLNTGGMIPYDEWEFSCLPHSFINHDYVVSMAYLFAPAKKKADSGKK